MEWGTVLSGVGGGLKGGLDMYSWQKEYAQKDRQLENQKEMASQRVQVQEIVALLKEKGLLTRHENPSGNTIAREEGANYRHDTVSGNAGLSADVTKRGQDLNYSIAGDRNDTTRRGQDISAETSRYGVDTRSTDSRYSTDTGATTARRGQDIGAGTSRRGQDLNFTLGTDRNELTGRGQDLNYSLDTTAEAGRDTRAATALKARSLYSGVFETPEIPAEPGAPSNIERFDVNLPAPSPPPAPFVPRRPGGGAAVAPSGPLPVTPRAAAPPAASPQPAAPAQNPMAQLEAQAATLLLQFRSEQDPAKKAALAAQLQRLKAQRLAMTGGGP